MNFSGDIIRCVAPSRQGVFSLSKTCLGASHCTRSLASAGRVMWRHGRSNARRSSAPQRTAACRLKPSISAHNGGLNSVCLGITPCGGPNPAVLMQVSAFLQNFAGAAGDATCIWRATRASATTGREHIATGGPRLSTRRATAMPPHTETRVPVAYSGCVPPARVASVPVSLPAMAAAQPMLHIEE